MAAGEREPLLADAGVEPVRQVVDELGLRDPEGFPEVGLVGVGAAEGQVLADAHREQRGLFERGGHDRAEVRQPQFADVGAVQQDAPAGRVTLDGVDVRDLPLTQLRRVVATAFEDATLFSMSVRENLTLGRPDASDDDVAEALRVAQAEFVHDLPWGLATRIGEQGLSLSGGQRQRLALARAVLGRPSVLVLDDPLSALDVHTEALVEAALREVLARTTALVVAHRASTVLLADRVALLAEGRIVAVGRHSDLLAELPAYRDLLAQDSELAEAAR